MENFEYFERNFFENIIKFLSGFRTLTFYVILVSIFSILYFIWFLFRELKSNPPTIKGLLIYFAIVFLIFFPFLAKDKASNKTEFDFVFIEQNMKLLQIEKMKESIPTIEKSDPSMKQVEDFPLVVLLETRDTLVVCPCRYLNKGTKREQLLLLTYLQKSIPKQGVYTVKIDFKKPDNKQDKDRDKKQEKIKVIRSIEEFEKLMAKENMNFLKKILLRFTIKKYFEKKCLFLDFFLQVGYHNTGVK